MGRVVDENGIPLPKANVFIYTAGPKDGKGNICPSCYPDCRKKTQTDAFGNFKIEALDAKLRFKILTVYTGHEAKFVAQVDPATGPLDIALKPLPPDDAKSRLRIAGVMIGPDGAPLVGAVISVEGVEKANVTSWGGNEKDVEPLAVTDEQGLFVFHCQEGVKTLFGIAEARGVAKRWVQLKTGGDHFIQM